VLFFNQPLQLATKAHSFQKHRRTGFAGLRMLPACMSHRFFTPVYARWAKDMQYRSLGYTSIQ